MKMKTLRSIYIKKTFEEEKCCNIFATFCKYVAMCKKVKLTKKNRSNGQLNAEKSAQQIGAKWTINRSSHNERSTKRLKMNDQPSGPKWTINKSGQNRVPNKSRQPVTPYQRKWRREKGLTYRRNQIENLKSSPNLAMPITSCSGALLSSCQSSYPAGSLEFHEHSYTSIHELWA